MLQFISDCSSHSVASSSLHGDGLLVLRVWVTAARLVIRGILVVLTSMSILLRFLLVDRHNWFISRCLRCILLLSACLFFLIFESQNTLLNLKTLSIEVRVKVFFKIYGNCPWLDTAFDVFGLCLCQICLWGGNCRRLAWTPLIQPTLLL